MLEHMTSQKSLPELESRLLRGQFSSVSVRLHRKHVGAKAGDEGGKLRHPHWISESKHCDVARHRGFRGTPQNKTNCGC